MMKRLMKAVCVLSVAPLLLPIAAAAGRDGFTDRFRLEECTWRARGAQNPYFPLIPGRQVTLEGEEDGEEIEVIMTTLRRTERVTFESPRGVTVSVRARVIEEREWVDGELVEVSRNWFAICRETGDVYYFGEDVDDYEDGEIVDHDGAWRAGVDGARPGIIMPGTFLLGSRYHQETAPGVAMDRARHVEDQITMPTAAGVFTECVMVKESSPLDGPGEFSFKIYCPNVGLVFDDVLELIDVGD